MSLAIVILATESGAQWGSRRLKALHTIGGKALVSHSVDAAAKVTAHGHIFVVAGEQVEQVKAAVAGSGARTVGSEVDWGAISACRDVAVLPSHLPMVRPETIERLLGALLHGDAAMVALVAEGESSGVFAFHSAALQARLAENQDLGSWSERSEAQITAIFEAAGDRVTPVEAYEPAEVLGAKTLPELMEMDATLRSRTSRKLMLSGVTIFRPETCVIDADVEVAPDTVIEPFVQLLGKTIIGSDCLIRSYSVLENCTLGDSVLLRQSCILTDSTVANGAKIGPFAHLRPGSEIGEDAHIGNFVETKKAKLGKGSKAGHLTYLGDAEVGEGCNIGAGVITCNYDGVHKHVTHIGSGAFVGSDSTLVAPVNIEDGAYIGAGSCITKDVPAGSLAVARAHQITKEGWVAARRARQKAEPLNPSH